jgi:2-phosphosulfolactate phosphatase
MSVKGSQIRLDVALTPSLLAPSRRQVCVVIDVLRATSALATMFAHGLREAIVAESIVDARRLAKVYPGSLLCGEERGLPPTGFDYGNSPAEFARMDLRGQRALIVTTNGTAALVAAASARVTLIGSLLNANASVAVAMREARTPSLNIVLVCSGEGAGSRPSLEDAFCAGAMVERAVRTRGAAVELSAGARIALHLYRSYRGSPRYALRESPHAAYLRTIGLGRDVPFCARRDAFAVVPRARRSRGGLVRIMPGQLGGATRR